MGAHSKTKEKPRAQARLRLLPAVDELLRQPRLARLAQEAGRPLVLEAARDVLAGLRAAIRRGLRDEALRRQLEHLAQEVEGEVRERLALSLRPIINATGVVLHTNLGRAPLSAQAVQHLASVATHYSNLEFDLARGARGRRDTHAAKFLDAALGARASIVVNNNAAAIYLVLNTLAEGGEVVVSRGELIEIGESFRIPDILAKSGATLREVGTTNRTRLADYGRALSKRTRLLLRVHPSNYAIVGFTQRPSLAELVALSRKARLPLVEDLGSGLLVELLGDELRAEPVAAASLRAGVDLVTFSGDKLLGGPQAGVIAGKKKWVERCRKNPLFRALRVDKMTYAALEATLRSYLRGALDEVPALRMIRLSPEQVATRAERLAAALSRELGEHAAVRLADGQSVVGGGSTPGHALPTKLVALCPRSLTPSEVAAHLRRADPPVIVRVEGGRVLLDLRTVFENQQTALVAAVSSVFSD